MRKKRKKKTARAIFCFRLNIFHRVILSKGMIKHLTNFLYIARVIFGRSENLGPVNFICAILLYTHPQLKIERDRDWYTAAVALAAATATDAVIAAIGVCYLSVEMIVETQGL